MNRMKSTKRWTAFTLTTAALAIGAACVTINVYFPEKAVKSLSEAIEREVNQESAAKPAAGSPDAKSPDAKAPAAAPDAAKPEGGKPAGGGSMSLLDRALGITPAMADEVQDPEVSNPAIRKIIDSRKARLADVRAWKSKGVLGENNQALLEARALDTVTDLKDRAAVQRIVREENADREQLFREIALAKKVDSSQIPKIRETYAATLRANAQPGDWVQGPDGNWAKK
jgi:uncharacterized protein YdbL (DUF1318 family)